LCTRTTCQVGFLTLKQQYVGRHVAPLGHIEPPDFNLTSWCSMLIGEGTNTNIIVFGLTRPRLESALGNERANHYTIDAVKKLTMSTITTGS